MEIWKTIDEYPDYMVSNIGRVKSLRYNKEKILKLQSDKDGYKQVNLFNSRGSKTHKVHRLVAQTFIPNPNNYSAVNHKDEDKANNTIWINEDDSIDYNKSNLEWCTIAYNNTYNNKIAKCYKPILQYSIDGKLIGKLDSLKEFGKHHSAISNCLSGKRKTAYGFIWRYYDLELYLMSKLFDRYNIKNKKVA